MFPRISFSEWFFIRVIGELAQDLEGENEEGTITSWKLSWICPWIDSEVMVGSSFSSFFSSPCLALLPDYYPCWPRAARPAPGAQCCTHRSVSTWRQ